MALSVVNPSRLNKWRVYLLETSGKMISSATSVTSMDSAIVSSSMATLLSGNALTSALTDDGYEEVGKCTGYPSWESTYGEGQLDNYGGTSGGSVTFNSTINLIGLTFTNWSEALAYHEKTVNLVLVAPDTGIVRQFYGVTAIVTDSSDDSGRQMVNFAFNKVDSTVGNFSTYSELTALV